MHCVTHNFHYDELVRDVDCCTSELEAPMIVLIHSFGITKKDYFSKQFVVFIIVQALSC